jgi:hypothetical protein
MPVSRAFFTHCSELRKKQGLLIEQNLTFLKVPSKGHPIHVSPQRGPYGEMFRRQSQWFIYSCIHISQSPDLGSPPTKLGKNMVTVHGASRGRKAYILVQWSAAWFPKEIVCDTDIISSMPCSLQYDTFHLGLGRTEPRYPACVI